MFDAFIDEASRAFNVPASWIRAVIATESSWNPRATNPSDPSYGLMALTLPTAKDMGYTGSLDGLYDPETNIQLGTKYIRWIMDRWNTADFGEMYSAYNSGNPTLWQTSQQVAANVARAVENLAKYGGGSGVVVILLAVGAFILWGRK